MTRKRLSEEQIIKIPQARGFGVPLADKKVPLNQHRFRSLAHTGAEIDAWRQDYNE